MFIEIFSKRMNYEKLFMNFLWLVLLAFVSHLHIHWAENQNMSIYNSPWLKFMSFFRDSILLMDRAYE